jgi:hypothetical protein
MRGLGKPAERGTQQHGDRDMIDAVIAADAAPLGGLVRSSVTNTVTHAAVRLTG